MHKVVSVLRQSIHPEEEGVERTPLFFNEAEIDCSSEIRALPLQRNRHTGRAALVLIDVVKYGRNRHLQGHLD